jgi:hypothetical protein
MDDLQLSRCDFRTAGRAWCRFEFIEKHGDAQVGMGEFWMRRCVSQRKLSGVKRNFNWREKWDVGLDSVQGWVS